MSTSNTTVRGKSGFVDPFSLCVFRQIRDGDEEQYTGIPELAEDIAGNDLMMPLTVCLWKRKRVEEYMQLVKFVFNGDSVYEMENYKPQEDGRYRVLVAGHRRLMALQMLRDEGCEVYRRNFPGKPSKECFLEHFTGDEAHPTPGYIAAKIYVDIPADRGFSLQLSENLNRKNISTPTQAKAIKGLYDLDIHKANGEGLTIVEFARRHEIKLSVARDALRFCELPRSIRRAVESGHFKWSCAIELTVIHRALKEQPKQDGTMRTDQEIELALLNLSASEAASKSLEIFRKYLKKWVSEVLGQLVMFEDLTLSSEQIATRMLGDEMLRGTVEHTIFLQKVSYALEHGWIKDEKLAPLHRAEVRRAVEAMLAEQRALQPLLRKILERGGFEELEDLCAKNSAAAGLVSLLAGDDPEVVTKT